MRAVRLCTQKNIAINTFMLDANYYLKAFMDQIAKINGGRVFYTTSGEVGGVHPRRLRAAQAQTARAAGVIAIGRGVPPTMIAPTM